MNTNTTSNAQAFQDPYFLRKEVSNSDLTALKAELGYKTYVDPTEAYAFGSLLDAMITEPEKIDWYRKLYNGVEVKDFDKARKMKNEFINNPKCMALIKGADFQKVSIANRDFEYKGIKFNLDVRCKWDWFGNISGDIKSTVATTQKQFIAACHYFDYFRSRAWYMDIENTDKDIIIGISKKNYKIFFAPIVRGDQYYNLGKQQYTELAFKYWMLKM